MKHNTKRKLLLISALSLLILSVAFLISSLISHFREEKLMKNKAGFGSEMISCFEEFHQFLSRMSKGDQIYYFKIKHKMYLNQVYQLRQITLFKVLLSLSTMISAIILLFWIQDLKKIEITRN
jgi:hypothetical protein